MATLTEKTDEKNKVKGFKIQYPVSAYTFPTEARIHRVRFDAHYIHLDLLDERILSIPLWWIPTLYNAVSEEREKYEINQARTMVIWDPEKCSINEELSIMDFLTPTKPEPVSHN